LCKDELCRFVLQVGWVAVFAKNSFDQNFDLGAGSFAKRPVDGDAFAGNKFRRDYFEVVFPITSSALLLAAKAS
jgi:hypothetical protein